MSRVLAKRALVCHPGMASRVADGMEIQVELAAGGRLWIRYHLEGMIGSLAVPMPQEPIRADHLWQTTCFELFLRKKGQSSYAEFNFSPSSRWAAYEFADYRSGMVNLELSAVPKIGLDASDSHFALETELQLPVGWEGLPLVAGFSAVVEDIDGVKSYWALAHPPGKPDFHHRDCFALTLPAPEAA